MKFVCLFLSLATAASPARGQAGGGASPAAERPSGQPSARERGATAEGTLSEPECRAYAQAIVKAVAGGQPADLNALVDWDAMFDAVAAGWDIPEKVREDVFAGLRTATVDRGIASRLCGIAKRGGTFVFLGVRRSHGRKVILFRMTLPTEGVNYYEFAPDRSPDGRVRAKDLYIYLTGEFFSESLRLSVLPVIADQSRTLSDKMPPEDRDYLVDLPRIQRATDLIRQGEPKAARAILDELRPGTKTRKIVLLLRIQSVQLSDQKEYAALLEEYQKRFPNDPSLDLLSIDAFVMRKDFSGAIGAVDRLDRSVGGDPYLDLLRANLSEARGDLKEARRFARRAVDREPSLLAAHWALVGYSLTNKDYDETLARLKEIDRTFRIVFNDLSKAPIYAGFVKSPQYARWLDYLKAKKAAGKPTPACDGDRPARKDGPPGTAAPEEDD
jgi:tetratricopeptide (TPR) repeat protein